jgi:hypothetical protein
VAGTVINHWMRPVPNVTVMIDGRDVRTDENGAFEVADVPEEYDAMLVVNYLNDNLDAKSGYVYEGLSLRDPTLQVFAGISESAGNLSFALNGVTDASNRFGVISVGGDYGNWQRFGTNGTSTTMYWFGPNMMDINAHALLLTRTGNLPSAYHSYDNVLASLSFDGTTAAIDFAFDLSDEVLSTGSISGEVTSPTTSDRTNRVYIRFPDNAYLQVVDHYGSSLTPSFSYLLPDIPNATVTILASEGSAFTGGAGFAMLSDVAPGDSGVQLTIPSPPTLNTPSDTATVSSTTTFSWSGTSETYLWRASTDGIYESIYVITTRNQITMPIFPNGFALRPNGSHSWRVHTHGDASNVDDMAGPQGFISEFAYSGGDTPEGPQRSSTTFTSSISRAFYTGS